MSREYVPGENVAHVDTGEQFEVLSLPDPEGMVRVVPVDKPGSIQRLYRLDRLKGAA